MSSPTSVDSRVLALRDALKSAAASTAKEIIDLDEEAEASEFVGSGDSTEDLEYRSNLEGLCQGYDHALDIVKELWGE